MAGYYGSCPCGWRECDGCEEEPEIDNETISLLETPEGQELEPIDPAIRLGWELFQAEEDERAKKAAEAAWAARRKRAA